MQQDQEREINLGEGSEHDQAIQDNPISLDGPELYNLPEKKKVTVSNLYHSRADLKNQEQSLYSADTKKLIEDIDRVLESHLFTWGETNYWAFKLPHTIFQGNEPPINFHQPQMIYGTHALSKLTPSQMDSIRQHGEFNVQGQTQDAQTTWRLNSWIIRGRDYIRECFYKGISFAFHQLTQIKCRLGWRYAVNYHAGTQIINPNLFNGIISIVSVASKLLNLVFGVRKVQVYNKWEIKSQILKERGIEIINHHHSEIQADFYKFIFRQDFHNDKKYFSLSEEEKIKERDLRTQFQELIEQFEQSANKLETERLKQLEKESLNEDEALMEIFLEKQKLLFGLIRSSKHIEDQNVQEHLISLITATQITKRYYYELEQQIHKKREEKTNEILKKHRIRSLVTNWRNDRIKEQLKPIISTLVQECNQKIIKELQENNLNSFVLLFNKFVEYQENEKQIYSQNYKRIQKQNTTPCRVFETYQYNFKPYRVIANTNSDGETTYSFDTGKKYLTPTSFFGWRVVLQLIRYKVWTKNAFITLIDNLVNGHFGLKALFKLTPFHTDQAVDYRTGQVRNIGQVIPYLVAFVNCMKAIKNSIQEFENQPDRGIFGKNFARIFKYIQQFVFRLILNIVIVGVGYPIAILVNCIISFALAISTWLWIPITLIIRSIFHLLFWDLDSPTRKGWCSYTRSYSRYQTYQAFPLIRGAFNIIFGTLEIGTSIASAAVLHPVLSVLSTVNTLLRSVGQKISDSIMCKLTSKIGRQPEIDTFIAWKVRGTGVTRQYTYSMDINDVKVVMRAHLERVELEEYERRLREKISEPDRIYDRLTQNIFRFYDISQSSNSYISSMNYKLQDILSKQISERRKLYPYLPRCNIKFTEEELQSVFFTCENVIRNFIETRKAEWIFAREKIENNDYKLLTERYLVYIFNDEDILYPISEIDKRIEIKTDKKTHFQTIEKAIQGQSTDKTFTATIKQKFKKFQKSFLFPFVDIRETVNNCRDITDGNFSYTKLQNPSKVAFNFNMKDYESIMKQQQQQ